MLCLTAKIIFRPLGSILTGLQGRSFHPGIAGQRRYHLTIGRRLILGAAAVVLLVAGLSFVSIRTTDRLLQVNQEVSESLERASLVESRAEQLTEWAQTIDQTQARITIILRKLLADMVDNRNELEVFVEDLRDPLGDYLASATARDLAEAFPQTDISFQALRQADDRLLYASRILSETWRPRHAGLAEGLNDLKGNLNYWNLKVANTIFIRSSMLELLADEVSETPVEKFRQSELFQRFAGDFPILDEKMASAAQTNGALYQASEALASLMLQGRWEEVRKYYRDSFPFMLKSILVDIDQILAVEQQSLVAQERAMELLNATLNQATESAAGALGQLQEVLRTSIDQQHKEVQVAAGDVMSRRSRMESALSRMRVINLAAPGVAIVIAVLGGLVMTRSVSRPLQQTVARLSEIAAGEGDLTRQLPVLSGDEVGQLALSFNRFMTRQRLMIGHLRSLAADLVSAAEQIRGVAAEVTAGATQQTSALEESTLNLQTTQKEIGEMTGNTGILVNSSRECSTATLQLGATIEEISEQMEHLFSAVEQVSSSTAEMSASSRQIEGSLESLVELTRATGEAINTLDEQNVKIEQNAQTADDLAQRATQDARRGLESVQASLQGVTDLSQVISSAGAVIQDLGGQSESIGRILTVIDHVADQTSLLALNAAIIAAQAGEGGRAFAVVADEIRTLANRTADSTRDIARIIGNLQATATEAVKVMDAGEQQALNEVQRSREAAEALDLIGKSTLSVRTHVTGIVESSHVQVNESRLIGHNIEQVNLMLTQISAAISQLAGGIRQNARASENMRQIAGRVNASTQEQATGSRYIAENMETVRAMMARIDHATREQSQRTSTTASAVGGIRMIAQATLNKTNDMDQVVDLLGRQAAMLHREIGAFRIES